MQNRLSVPRGRHEGGFHLGMPSRLYGSLSWLRTGTGALGGLRIPRWRGIRRRGLVKHEENLVLVRVEGSRVRRSAGGGRVVVSGGQRSHAWLVAVVAGAVLLYATPAQADVMYRGHIRSAGHPGIQLVIGRSEGRPRWIHYVNTGQVALHCERGAVSQVLRFGFQSSGIFISPSTGRFGYTLVTERSPRVVTRSRIVGRVGRHRARGALRMRIPRIGNHGACKSGRVRWWARRG
jgi:hypothetical protein